MPSKPDKEYKEFEKSRKKAEKTGYGETPIIPRVQLPQSSSSPHNPYYEKTGYSNPMMMNYPNQVSSTSMPMPNAPFSYTNNTTPGYYQPPSVSYVDDGKSGQSLSYVGNNASEIVVENVLVKNRRCRDVLCLALFAAFLALMAGVAVFAITTGDLKRLGDSSNVDVKCKISILQRNTTPRNTIDDSFQDLAHALETSWKPILYICLIAVGFSIVMTILLRLFAGIIIWFAVAVFSILVIGATIAAWIWYTNAEQSVKTGSLVVAIVVSIISFIFLVLLFAMRRRIALVVQLFKEAGKAVHAVPTVLIQPLWTFMCTSVVSCAFVFLMVLLETSADSECKKPSFATYGRYLNIFAYLWMVQFIIACQHVVVAGAVAQWYFIRDKSDLSLPLLTSFKNLVRYHLGSIAFGSLIIAILKFIRFILTQIKKRIGGANICCKAIMCCCQCFFWCLDTMIQFINRNAYIEIAIYGKAFCPSAKRAFNLILNNALSLSAINSIGDFVLFLSKLAIVGLSGTCGYFILKADLKDEDKMDSEYAVLAIGIVFSYFIAHCCLSIYEMCIDSIFVCFCEDKEMNDGSSSKPYFMSKGLMDFMKKSEKLGKKKKNKGD